MFGGLAFMLRGNMCCGILEDRIVLRLGPEAAEQALRSKHVREMDFTGRPMKGYVYLMPGGHKTDASLKKWINAAVAFVIKLPRKRR